MGGREGCGEGGGKKIQKNKVGFNKAIPTTKW